MLRPLTRPELDALMADMEHANLQAVVALSSCPLEPSELESRCGVAQDALTLWQEALDESMWRWWHGEPLA
jgi:hypothetical protein